MAYPFQSIGNRANLATKQFNPQFKKDNFIITPVISNLRTGTAQYKYTSAKSNYVLNSYRKTVRLNESIKLSSRAPNTARRSPVTEEASIDVKFNEKQSINYTPISPRMENNHSLNLQNHEVQPPEYQSLQQIQFNAQFGLSTSRKSQQPHGFKVTKTAAQMFDYANVTAQDLTLSNMCLTPKTKLMPLSINASIPTQRVPQNVWSYQEMVALPQKSPVKSKLQHLNFGKGGTEMNRKPDMLINSRPIDKPVMTRQFKAQNQRSSIRNEQVLKPKKKLLSPEEVQDLKMKQKIFNQFMAKKQLAHRVKQNHLVSTLKQLAAAVDICEDATCDLESDNEVEAGKKDKIRASFENLHAGIPRNVFNINKDSAPLPLEFSIQSAGDGDDNNHSSEELLLIMESHGMPMNQSLDTTQSKQEHISLDMDPLQKNNTTLHKKQICTQTPQYQDIHEDVNSPQNIAELKNSSMESAQMVDAFNIKIQDKNVDANNYFNQSLALPSITQPKQGGLAKNNSIGNQNPLILSKPTLNKIIGAYNSHQQILSPIRQSRDGAPSSNNDDIQHLGHLSLKNKEIITGNPSLVSDVRSNILEGFVTNTSQDANSIHNTLIFPPDNQFPLTPPHMPNIYTRKSIPATDFNASGGFNQKGTRNSKLRASIGKNTKMSNDRNDIYTPFIQLQIQNGGHQKGKLPLQQNQESKFPSLLSPDDKPDKMEPHNFENVNAKLIYSNHKKYRPFKVRGLNQVNGPTDLQRPALSPHEIRRSNLCSKSQQKWLKKNDKSQREAFILSQGSSSLSRSKEPDNNMLDKISLQIYEQKLANKKMKGNQIDYNSQIQKLVTKYIDNQIRNDNHQAYKPNQQEQKEIKQQRQLENKHVGKQALKVIEIQDNKLNKKILSIQQKVDNQLREYQSIGSKQDIQDINELMQCVKLNVDLVDCVSEGDDELDTSFGNTITRSNGSIEPFGDETNHQKSTSQSIIIEEANDESSVMVNENPTNLNSSKDLLKGANQTLEKQVIMSNPQSMNKNKNNVISEKNISPQFMKRRYEASKTSINSPMSPESCVQSHDFLAPVGKGLIKHNVFLEKDSFKSKNLQIQKSNGLLMHNNPSNPKDLKNMKEDINDFIISASQYIKISDKKFKQKRQSQDLAKTLNAQTPDFEETNSKKSQNKQKPGLNLNINTASPFKPRNTQIVPKIQIKGFQNNLLQNNLTPPGNFKIYDIGVGMSHPMTPVSTQHINSPKNLASRNNLIPLLKSSRLADTKPQKLFTVSAIRTTPDMKMMEKPTKNGQTLREKLNIDQMESEEVQNQQLQNIKLTSSAHNSSMQKQQKRLNTFNRESVQRNTNTPDRSSVQPSGLDNINTSHTNSNDDTKQKIKELQLADSDYKDTKQQWIENKNKVKGDQQSMIKLFIKKVNTLTQKEMSYKQLQSQNHILEIRIKSIKRNQYLQQVHMQNKLMDQIKDSDLKKGNTQNIDVINQKAKKINYQDQLIYLDPVKAFHQYSLISSSFTGLQSKELEQQEDGENQNKVLSPKHVLNNDNTLKDIVNSAITSARKHKNNNIKQMYKDFALTSPGHTNQRYDGSGHQDLKNALDQKLGSFLPYDIEFIAEQVKQEQNIISHENKDYLNKCIGMSLREEKLKQFETFLQKSSSIGKDSNATLVINPNSEMASLRNSRQELNTQDSNSIIQKYRYLSLSNHQQI